MALFWFCRQHLNAPATLDEICAEYWRQPQHQWNYFECLDRTMIVLDEVAPPDPYAVQKRVQCVHGRCSGGREAVVIEIMGRLASRTRGSPPGSSSSHSLGVVRAMHPQPVVRKVSRLPCSVILCYCSRGFSRQLYRAAVEVPPNLGVGVGQRFGVGGEQGSAPQPDGSLAEDFGSGLG